jgi:hypothetical protein
VSHHNKLPTSTPGLPPSSGGARHRSDDTERVKRIVGESLAGGFQRQLNRKLGLAMLIVSAIGVVVTGATAYYANLGKKVDVSRFEALEAKAEATAQKVAGHDVYLKDIAEDVHFIKEHMFEKGR